MRLCTIFEIELVSKFIKSSCQSHLQITKRILLYIKGTPNDSDFYTYGNKVQFVGYANSDCASDVEKQKSTSSYASRVCLIVFLFKVFF